MTEPEPAAIVLERYQLQKELQRRDHTHTWQALDIQNQQQVIVKILNFAENADWQAYTLFEREAQALKSLNHPRIPQLLTFARESQQIILVQEAIAGESLRERMNRGWKLTEAQARKLAVEILELLQLLHSQDPPLIHRDIKPENLLLDAQDRPFLIDFGAVRQFAQNSYTVAGSFQYMAPEQLQGKAEPASDLYALGMTLIELLSGSPLQELPREGLYVQFQDALHVSEGLKRWLEQMVAPYAIQRFSSAQEALNALENTETLATLKKRGQPGPSHGKKELTAHIWMRSREASFHVEFTGQKTSIAMSVRALGVALGMVFIPVTAVPLSWVVEGLLKNAGISMRGGLDVFLLLGLGLFVTLPLAIVFTFRFMQNITTQLELDDENDHLTVSYLLKRGLRKPKKVSKKFPHKTIRYVILTPFQIGVQYRAFIFKPYSVTLSVPFKKAQRQEIASELEQRGLKVRVK